MKSFAMFAVKVLAVVTIANQIPALSGLTSGTNKFFK